MLGLLGEDNLWLEANINRVGLLGIGDCHIFVWKDAIACIFLQVEAVVTVGG